MQFIDSLCFKTLLSSVKKKKKRKGKILLHRGIGSDVANSAYMSDIALAKYAFACGLLIWKKENENEKQF